jgi:hypothetical protein
MQVRAGSKPADAGETAEQMLDRQDMCRRQAPGH